MQQENLIFLIVFFINIYSKFTTNLFFRTSDKYLFCFPNIISLRIVLVKNVWRRNNSRRLNANQIQRYDYNI